jgi:hypothetical protein
MSAISLFDTLWTEREVWRSSGGGTSEEESSFLIEHDAGVTPRPFDVERLVTPQLTDRNGYVGRDIRVHFVTGKVKVYGLADGREVSQFNVRVEKEW